MKLIQLDARHTTSELPTLFKDQIFYSQNSTLNGFTYTSSYTLKFAISGKERYYVQGKGQSILSNEHLLVNEGNEITTHSCYGRAISIFISLETMKDVYTNIHAQSLSECLDSPDSVRSNPIFKTGIYQTQNPLTHNLLICIYVIAFFYLSRTRLMLKIVKWLTYKSVCFHN